MPELPEVETTRRGVAPHCVGRRVVGVVVRDPRLRWPVPADLDRRLTGQTFSAVERRAKYLLLRTPAGTLLVHLGMSGSLRLVAATAPPGRHDHIDVQLAGGQALRFNDPRRFGCCLWLEPEAEADHALLAALGPEPLSAAFSGDYLYRRSRGRKGAVKTFIMDGKVVVGVGNIYANEALFAAGIRPDRAAGRISRARYGRLAQEIRRILQRSIRQGGTTLRDFVGGDGKPGYFRQQLNVYGRAGEPCKHCAMPLRELRLGQRATVFCVACQR
jgi:formamidopyrimidine-DNA glycosylase